MYTSQPVTCMQFDNCYRKRKEAHCLSHDIASDTKKYAGRDDVQRKNTHVKHTRLNVVLQITN